MRKRTSAKALPEVDDGNSEVVLYEAPGGEVKLDVRLDRDTAWLTQAQMADLFGRERSVVTKHLRNVFQEGELEQNSVCANFALVAFGSSSPSSNTLRRCLVTTDRSRPNKSAI